MRGIAVRAIAALRPARPPRLQCGKNEIKPQAFLSSGPSRAWRTRLSSRSKRQDGTIHSA